jgi:imidazolonepropionase-like amidohydrolase
MFSTRKSLAFKVVALVAVAIFVFSCRPPAQRAIAVTHCTVIDATGSPPQPDTTVIISGGKITAIGPSSSTAIPRNAQIIDAAGKFLIPGLADMHVHLTGAGEPTGSREFILPLLIANGITTVRDMGGNVEDLLRLRNEISSGVRLGPQIFFTGPYLDGDPPNFQPSIVVKSANEARVAVDRLVAQGVDFLKVQSSLNREAYFAIADESKTLHKRFVGHVPDRVTALETSQAGQASIEHLTGILLACSSKEEELQRASLSIAPGETEAQARIRVSAWQRELLNTYSPEKAGALLRAFVSNNTSQVPTFPILVNLVFMTPQTNLFNDPRVKFISKKERSIWQPGVSGQLEHTSKTDFALREEIVKRFFEIVGRMQASGVRIMAGTDTAAPNVFPGSSLHDDMAFLVQAGLTPMQTLQAATKNPAEFLGNLDSHGTVEPGKVADLLLLDANPLDDIRNTQKIRMVFVRGTALDRKALDGILAKVEEFASAN